MAHSSFSNMLLNNSDDNEIIIKYLMKEGSSSQCDTVQRRYIECDHLQGYERLSLDYFAESLVYPPNIFWRRFRIRRSLFLRIQFAVEGHDDYFIQKRDNAQRLGLSSLQKITAALRMLAYEVTADFMDEYVRIGESTAMESLKKFVKAVVSIFSEEYLRSLNNKDIARLLADGESHGFPRMLGFID
uniref:Uncharacterized protein n=1 Tax=Fagus sylvatica TaxID=28930 RepID=A0A2N9F248_FAGSY